jgi:hypothetical protein
VPTSLLVKIKEFLKLPNAIAFHDTFGRLFAKFDPKGLHAFLTRWVHLVGAVREPPLQLRPRKPPNQGVYMQLRCFILTGRGGDDLVDLSVGGAQASVKAAGR